MPLNIVLVEPEIPNNTGNIGRLCLATNSILHLVKPYGFELSESRLKRAGLDYWQHLEVREYNSWNEFTEQHKNESLAFLTKKGKQTVFDLNYSINQFLVFGKESVGLSKSIVEQYENDLFSIPMFSNKVRSLNLANAVAITIYEGVKQGRNI